MLTVYLTTIGRSIPSHYFHSTSSQSTAASRFPRRNPHTIRINYLELVEARKIFQVTITFFVDCYRTTSRMFLSHGQTQGVTVQPWADTSGHSTAMSRHRGSHSTAMGRHKRPKDSHRQTKEVKVQPCAQGFTHVQIPPPKVVASTIPSKKGLKERYLLGQHTHTLTHTHTHTHTAISKLLTSAQCK